MSAQEPGATVAPAAEKAAQAPSPRPPLPAALSALLDAELVDEGLSRRGLFPERIVHELSKAQMERLLLWSVAMRASDLVFCPGDPVWLKVDGVWKPVMDTAMSDAETQRVVNETTAQANRAGFVKTGRSIDYACTVRVPGSRGLQQRFRVNATSSNKGIYLVLRPLPMRIPTLADIEGLEPALLAALYPPSGLVAVSGVMGSGKSTLLAAVLNTAIRSRRVGRQILTLEDPIEFDFSTIPPSERVAPVTQSAVHLDVESWPAGVRTMTRRAGEIVMVGECRDEETLSALLSTVEQGVTAYTTVHAQDVPQTVTRMVNAFPEGRRASVASVLKANLRLLVHQRLVPRRRRPGDRQGTPGRIALREFLPLTEDIRRALYRVSYGDLVPALRRLVAEEGQSLLADARRKHRQGLIGDETFEAVRHEQETAASEEGGIRQPSRPRGPRARAGDAGGPAPAGA